MSFKVVPSEVAPPIDSLSSENALSIISSRSSVSHAAGVLESRVKNRPRDDVFLGDLLGLRIFARAECVEERSAICEGAGAFIWTKGVVLPLMMGPFKADGKDTLRSLPSEDELSRSKSQWILGSWHPVLPSFMGDLLTCEEFEGNDILPLFPISSRGRGYFSQEEYERFDEVVRCVRGLSVAV